MPRRGGVEVKIKIDRLTKKEYTSAAGKPYSKLWIKSGEDWYGAFAGKWNDSWQEGQTIEVSKVTEDKGRDGKIYRNIEAPSLAEAFARIEALEEALSRFTQSSPVAGTSEEPPTEAYDDGPEGY